MGQLMADFLEVFYKVISITIMIAVGYVISKKKMITAEGASEITGILLKIVTPCVIISAFEESKGSVTINQMLMSVCSMLVFMVISILISRFTFKKENEERRAVLQFATMFSNMGFMGVPLVNGIVGGRGVVYATFGIVVFNIVNWTYGYRLMNKDEKVCLKTAFLNPGMIGLLIGLPIYFIKFNMPSFIMEPVDFFRGINTPLAMVILGSYIAKVDVKSFVTDLSVYKSAALRLVVIPAVFFGALMLMRLEHDMFVSAIIQAATPTAATVVLFSVQFKKDSELASRCVAVSTVLSIVTLSAWTLLAQIVSAP